MEAGRFRDHDRGEIVSVNVLTCRFPLTFSGQPIHNPEAFANYIRRKHRGG